MFIDETAAAIAYDDEEEGWILVARETDENDEPTNARTSSSSSIEEYDELDHETALKQAIIKLSGLPEDAVETVSAALADLTEE